MRLFRTVAMLAFVSIIAAGILFTPIGADAKKKVFQETPPPEMPARITGVKPISPQPQPGNVAPGLNVTYVFGKWRHLDDMPGLDDPPDKQDEPHRVGRPILKLDNRFGSGQVFDSGRACCVGAHISGMIRFDKTGDYKIQALSNDGVRVLVGGQVVVQDPAQHRDRVSVPVTVNIETSGWYSLEVKYYQRKGTAALSLQWLPPGATEFLPVPEEALGRIQK